MVASRFTALSLIRSRQGRIQQTSKIAGRVLPGLKHFVMAQWRLRDAGGEIR